MQRVLWGRFGFQNLLFWLFVYLVVSPFMTTLPHSRYIFQFLLTLVLLFAVLAVHRKKGIMTLSVTLMALTLVFLWLGVLGVIRYSDQVSHLIMVLYLATLVYSFFRAILSATKVTSSLICATLCLYLIIGLLWGALFVLLEAVAPGSFSGGVLDHASSMADRLYSFVYFSFITLTTLGYGDITPQTQGAGALCQAEAIVGQFYIAVLVARFVSMYGMEMNRGNSDG
jgi:voltage-gated potassium channel